MPIPCRIADASGSYLNLCAHYLGHNSSFCITSSNSSHTARWYIVASMRLKLAALITSSTLSTTSHHPCQPEHIRICARNKEACKDLRCTEGLAENSTRCWWSRTQSNEHGTDNSPDKATHRTHRFSWSLQQENRLHWQARQHLCALQTQKKREYWECQAPCKGCRG